ncbi:MAG: tail fiber domain-containing protein [Chitinophagaceae bacterium]|nr:tail fiber domain-containing protein [Chitinophagaceae bacterium]
MDRGQTGWFNYSDERIKDNIRSNVPGLAFITRLNPVTYHLNIHRKNEMGYKNNQDWEGKYDMEKILQTGFLAQEVEQAAKETNFDFNGVRAPHGNSKLYSIQYASFVVPLVKAVQEQQQQIEELKNQVAELISIIKK